MNKTAMQDFAEKLLSVSKQKEKEGSYCAAIWNLCHHWALQHLHQEKQQLSEAFNEDRECLSHYEDGTAFEEYYKSKYVGKDA